MNIVTRAMGRLLANYLTRPTRKYAPFSVHDTSKLARCLQPADVLLVEGNLRLSTAIKYLTQSTWSHSAMYIGDALGTQHHGEIHCLIEADLNKGVVTVPLSTYANFNTRICRPVGLSMQDRQRVIEFMLAHIGQQYDLKNIFDLTRYLLPTPPVPVRWRRRLIALGSGDPTRAICSTLIAQAFELVKYPVLPIVTKHKERYANSEVYTEKEILHIRHHSLFTPRDFDISPYFEIVKPTLVNGFDYRQLTWEIN